MQYFWRNRQCPKPVWTPCRFFDKLQGDNYKWDDWKTVIKTNWSDFMKILLLQTFSPLCRLQLIVKKIFQNPIHERKIAVFVTKARSGFLRKLLLLSKSRFLKSSYLFYQKWHICLKSFLLFLTCRNMI